MRLVLVALTSMLVACGSTTVQPADSTADSVASTSESLSSIVRSIILPYATQMTGLFPVVTTNVPTAGALTDCMTAQGMSLNGLTGDTTSQTTIPVDALISPMLTFLLESCSGVPASEWSAG